jgi:Flp pilus assembly protein TadD
MKELNRGFTQMNTDLESGPVRAPDQLPRKNLHQPAPLRHSTGSLPDPAPFRMISSLKQRALFIILIAAAAFAVYAPSLRNGYVWDDSALIERDPFIRSWRLIPEGFRHFLFTDATASNFYRPIQRLTYTWDYAWYTFQPEGYHFTSILIHALAAVFLFLFLERLLGLFERPRATQWAAAMAGLWAVHPLYTSAVCYISGRADPLAALFGFCGLWLALRFTRTSSALAALMFFCAILSKESGAIFLPLCLALLILLRRPRPVILRWTALCVVIVAACLSMRLSADHSPPPPAPPLAWEARPIVALRAFAEYAGLFVAPIRLHMERDVLPFGRGDISTTLHIARNREFQTLLGAVLLAAFFCWMRWARRRDPAVFAGLICFLVAYLPISGLFSLNASVAEHWLYVPGAFLLLAALLSAARLPVSRPAGVAILALWALFLGGRTFLRNPDWHDQRTFLERTIADGGDSARMYINLGVLELTDGHAQLAIGEFRKALTLSPDQPFGLISLGSAYVRTRQFELARQQFEKALAFPITRAEAFQALAVVEYQESGKDRLDLLEKAAQLAPENWPVQKRLIEHLGERGQLVAAISILRSITIEQPWRGDTWRLLGDFWAHVRKFDSAERAYRKAIDLDVHDDDTPRKLAAVEDQMAR